MVLQFQEWIELTNFIMEVLKKDLMEIIPGLLKTKKEKQLQLLENLTGMFFCNIFFSFYMEINIIKTKYSILVPKIINYIKLTIL